MASRRAKLLKDYPNFNNRNLMHTVGCVDEFTDEEAKEVFMRICFQSVRIVQIKPLQNNHQPSCIWRVYYKLIDPNLEFFVDNSGKDVNPVCSDDTSVAQPLPVDEQSLKKLFMDITALCDYVGMNVVQKQIHVNEDKSYAIVEYSPKSCSCTCQDFKLAAEEPLTRPTITEVEMDLYCMKL